MMRHDYSWIPLKYSWFIMSGLESTIATGMPCECTRRRRSRDKCASRRVRVGSSDSRFSLVEFVSASHWRRMLDWRLHIHQFESDANSMRVAYVGILHFSVPWDAIQGKTADQNSQFCSGGRLPGRTGDSQGQPWKTCKHVVAWVCFSVAFWVLFKIVWVAWELQKIIPIDLTRQMPARFWQIVRTRKCQ